MSDQVTNASAAISEAATELNPTDNNNTPNDNSQDTLTNASEEAKLAKIANDPKAPLAQKVEAKKTLKRLKLKVDGQEFDEDLPFEIPDTPEARDWATRNLQLAKMSQKRAQEKSTLEKEVLQLVADLKRDPARVLSDPSIGLDLKEFAAKIIEQEIENSKKSPEQLKAEQLEAELKRLKEDRQKEQDELKAKEFERLKEQEFERYDMLMTQAIEKSDLPKEPYVVKKIADYMLIGLQSGKDITPEDVIPLVREEITNDIKHLASVLPEESLEKLFGDVVKKLRKKNVAKAKQASANPALKAPTKVAETGKTAEAKATEKKQNFRSFFGV